MTRALLTFAAISLAASLAGCSTPAVPADAAASPTTSAPSPTPAVEATTLQAGPAMTKDDVEATVKITEKHCFGSAGCNVKYEVALATSTVDPSGTYDITYDVLGLEDVATETTTVTDGKYNQQEQIGRMSKSSDKLTATVTDVVKQ